MLSLSRITYQLLFNENKKTTLPLPNLLYHRKSGYLRQLKATLRFETIQSIFGCKSIFGVTGIEGEEWIVSLHCIGWSNNFLVCGGGWNRSSSSSSQLFRSLLRGWRPISQCNFWSEAAKSIVWSSDQRPRYYLKTCPWNSFSIAIEKIYNYPLIYRAI